MKRDCTELFQRYREVARLVWNLGFWPNPALREYDGVAMYEEVALRLFEGMIMLPLGYGARFEANESPGEAVEFRVEVTAPGTELKVERDPPGEAGHYWGKPVLQVTPEGQQLRFLGFVDWLQLAPRDFRFLKVLIERCEGHPGLVGHHALIEFDACSIWLVEGEGGLDGELVGAV